MKINQVFHVESIETIREIQGFKKFLEWWKPEELEILQSPTSKVQIAVHISFQSSHLTLADRVRTQPHFSKLILSQLTENQTKAFLNFKFEKKYSK